MSDRQIARTLRCRRSRVRDVRELGAQAPQLITALPADTAEPAWACRIEWTAVVGEISRGFEIKRIWEERASGVTSYSNFWKYLSRRYAWLLKRTVTLREFDPGTHCEVDWAGDKIPWWDRHGHRHEAHVFIGILCHSQLIFAWAASDEKKHHWLAAHQKMYAFFGGVPRVTVPDNLKTGVSKAHLYDPDLNPGYTELARHYGTAVIPARAKRPRDKALVENAVGIVMRLFRWVHRNHRFHSLQEITLALAAVCERINNKQHSRFRTSRRERFESLERSHLRPLPELPFEEIEWRTATLHPDCTISVEGAYYSAPHIHRGKQLRVKLTARQLEIFVALERVALWARDRSKGGVRHIDPKHLPPNSQAYREATPQNVLSQARFLSPELHAYIEALFQDDTLAHLRRSQGFLRHAREEINRFGRSEAEPRISAATEQMRRFGKPRVPFFEEQIKRLRKTRAACDPWAADREIERRPGNPMLRGTGEPREHGRPDLTSAPDQQLHLLIMTTERKPEYEHDSSPTPHAGAQAPRHGQHP